MKRILVAASLLLSLCLRVPAFAVCSLNGTASSSSSQIVLANDLTFGTWLPNTAYAQGAFVIDSNGNTQHATTGGTSGASAPSWGTSTPGSTTTSDGTVTWTLQNLGRADGTSAGSPVIKRHYLQIQNSGTANPMQVAIGSNNNATSKDVYLNPGSMWTMTVQGGAIVPSGDVAVISASGTNYNFCDY